MTYNIIIYEENQQLRVRYILNDEFKTWADKLFSEEVNMSELLKNAEVK